MRIWVVALFVAAASILPSTAGAHTPASGSPLANREHPRLWLTRGNLPTVRAKLSGDFRAEYQAFVSELDQRMADPKNWFNWGNDILRRSAHILAGLAFWGDGIDDAAANSMVDKYATLIEGSNGVLGAGSFYSGSDGGWSMGMSYSFNSATGVATPRVMEGWRTANNLSRDQVFGSSSANVIRYYPKWFAYNVLPQTQSCASCPGGFRFPMYRTHAMDSAKTADSLGWDLVATLASMRLYKSIDPGMAGLAQWLMEQRTFTLGSTGYAAQAFGVFSNFITGEKGISAKSPTDLSLPLTKLFGNAGWAVMRTGWSNAADTVVTFMASPFSRAAGSYSNFNQGSFTITKNGPLAINSGSGIHHEYAQETWATNTIIFPDPNESAKPIWDKGGQRLGFPQLYGTNQLTSGSAFDIGGIKRFNSGSGYDYAYADLTRAYNGPNSSDGYNTAKVAGFTRQLVYFHPDSAGQSDYIVVFDRATTADTRFEKRWLLHPSAASVSINGAGTTVRAGKVEYTGADQITAVNTANGSHGKMSVKTLLPAQRKIVLIGGAGHEFEDPYGTNDTTDSRVVDAQYSGTYRVEVVPAVRSNYDMFLNVIEASDSNSGSAAPAALLSGTTVVGARVSDKIAVFSSTESQIGNGTLTIDQAGTYEVLISDLMPRTSYTIGTATLTSSDAGTIFTTVSAGAGSPLAIRSGTGTATAVPPQPVPSVRVE
jgi:hypothetical protein